MIMARTKRIYNSYLKYGRFMSKSASMLYQEMNGIFQRVPPSPYPVKDPKEDTRWHPYKNWCMGNCKCHRKNNPKYEDKRRKRNTILKIMKFDQGVVHFA